MSAEKFHNVKTSSAEVYLCLVDRIFLQTQRGVSPETKGVATALKSGMWQLFVNGLLKLRYLVKSQMNYTKTIFPLFLWMCQIIKACFLLNPSNGPRGMRQPLHHSSSQNYLQGKYTGHFIHNGHLNALHINCLKVKDAY